MEKPKRESGRAGPPVEPLLYCGRCGPSGRAFGHREYGQIIELFEGVKIRFVDAGHLLALPAWRCGWRRAAWEKKIVFSGDIGNVNQPIIRDPSWVHGADYVVMESTYGDRNHAPVASYTAELAKIIDDTFSKGAM